MVIVYCDFIAGCIGGLFEILRQNQMKMFLKIINSKL